MQVEWKFQYHHSHQSACSHPLWVQPLEVYPLELIPRKFLRVLLPFLGWCHPEGIRLLLTLAYN